MCSNLPIDIDIDIDNYIGIEVGIDTGIKKNDDNEGNESLHILTCVFICPDTFIIHTIIQVIFVTVSAAVSLLALTNMKAVEYSYFHKRWLLLITLANNLQYICLGNMTRLQQHV